MAGGRVCLLSVSWLGPNYYFFKYSSLSEFYCFQISAELSKCALVYAVNVLYVQMSLV